MASFTFRAFVNAPIETVFDVLTDHRAYPEFTPIRSVRLEREGEPGPNGVGAIRVLSLLGPPLREEVTEYVAPTRFAYRMLSGAPLRDHTGTVDLVSEGGGTRMTYVTTTTPTVPGPLQPVGVAVVRLSLRQLFNGIKRHSEEIAGTRT